MNPEVQSFPDAAVGLQFEADLFSSQGAQVGIWSAQRNGLVCPRAYVHRSGFEGARDHSEATNWPVHLRPTGGGTVPQGPGIDNVSLAFNAPKSFTIDDTYRMLTGILKSALDTQDAVLEAGDTPGSFCDGAWNLSFAGKKIIGTAQRWRPVRGGRPRVLAHALVLTNSTFAPGANAVDAFHRNLGLGAIHTDAHTSLSAEFGYSELPADAIFRIAGATLQEIHA
ncbi:MAG: hypothetical protein AAF393_17690 [Pseudomonadota bacterium]